jgi:hypothetical protein
MFENTFKEKRVTSLRQDKYQKFTEKIQQDATVYQNFYFIFM